VNHEASHVLITDLFFNLVYHSHHLDGNPSRKFVGNLAGVMSRALADSGVFIPPEDLREDYYRRISGENYAD
jgi:hypothetical protein